MLVGVPNTLAHMRGKVAIITRNEAPIRIYQVCDPIQVLHRRRGWFHDRVVRLGAILTWLNSEPQGRLRYAGGSTL